jgi:hypothetical protein
VIGQPKIENSVPDALERTQEASDAEKISASGDDTASELVDALDNLLLERAVQEHREALSRLNKLKLALDQNGKKSPDS